MSDRISVEDASLWADVINDAEALNTLTVGQIRNMGGKLRQFQAQQTARRANFEDEGYSVREVQGLMDAENAAISDGSYDIGGSIGKWSTRSRIEVDGVARLINSGV